MKIVVIAGGLSPEREVSLSSGSLIANALIDEGYKVCLIDLYMGIDTNDFDEIFISSESGKKYNYTVSEHEPDLNQLKEESHNENSLIGRNVIDICKNADLTFLALHGDIGENGKLQAVFDSFGITYTGTGYIGSLLAMDKDLSKKLMFQKQILTPQWDIINLEGKNIDLSVCPIEFPCVIKPCSCGSSVGVSIVNNINEYIMAANHAKKYEQNIIVERMIKGREFSVGILDNEALPVIEIIPKDGFYDYKNKYQPDFTTEICPAVLSEKISRKMMDLALQVHNLLRLGSYSRIDFILDNDDNIFCLEANTLPGMTPTSLLPQEAKAIGMSFNELCVKITQMALSSQ